MKRIILAGTLGCLLSALPAKAQSTGDLIQILLLDYQKLGTLKGTLQEMYTGYTIINKGYMEIRDIASGNFNLHKLFLDGLLAISPAVRNYVRIADIIESEYNLVKEYKAASARWHNGGRFTVAELNYFDQLYSSLLDRNLQRMDELTMVLTAEELRMPDAQRMQAIDRVYADIGGQLQHLRQFNDQVSVQALQREKEAQNINTLKQLYGNPD